MAGNLKRIKKNKLLSLRQRPTMYGEVIISVDGKIERDVNERMRQENDRYRHYCTGATLMSFHSRSWESYNGVQFRMQVRMSIPKDHWFNTEPIVGRRAVRRITFVEEDSDI